MDKKRVDPGKVGLVQAHLELHYLLYGGRPHVRLRIGSVVIAESDLCCNNVARNHSPFSRLHILVLMNVCSLPDHCTCTSVLGTRRGSSGYIITVPTLTCAWMCLICTLGFPSVVRAVVSHVLRDNRWLCVGSLTDGVAILNDLTLLLCN